MMKRKLTLLGAAVLGATLAMSAGAQDRNASGYRDSGDRGVVTPANAPDASGPNMQNLPRGGMAVYPSGTNPATVPDQQPARVGQLEQSPLVRDSRMRPSPITPGNVSDTNSSASVYDRTNDGGMGYGNRGWGRGGTR